MALPISVTYTFATATSAIPLSQLDSNFTTVVNGINGIGNGTNALSNVVITGGTIDGATIGATTSSTGRFSTVTATTGNITTINATTTNSATVRADGNLTFQSNGTTTAMTITTAQNVGIGTTSPSAPLDVQGASGLIRTTSTTGTNTTNIGFTNTGGSFYVGLDNSTGGNFGAGNYGALLYNGANSPMVFFTNVTERARITSAGNVGIGTSLPAQKFVVSNAGAEGIEVIPAVNANESRLQSYNRSTASWNKFSINCGTYELFVNGGTSAIYANTSGNVGIGTTSPSRPLDISAASASAALTSTTGTNAVNFNFNNTGGLFAVGIDNSAGSGFGAAAYGRVIYSGGAYPLVFFTNDTERARINSSGNLMVGRTSTLNSGIVDVKSLSGQNCFVAQIQNNGNSNFQGFNTSGTATFFVDGTGQIYAAFTSIASTSDRNQKENIEPIKYGLNEVCALNPVSYDFKDEYCPEGKGLLGFIAQDVEPILPELVKPFGDSGNLGLKMGDMVPVLVKAIQELKAELDALKGAK